MKGSQPLRVLLHLLPEKEGNVNMIMELLIARIA